MYFYFERNEQFKIESSIVPSVTQSFARGTIVSLLAAE
jgi:hypothetical protein